MVHASKALEVSKTPGAHQAAVRGRLSLTDRLGSALPNNEVPIRPIKEQVTPNWRGRAARLQSRAAPQSEQSNTFWQVPTGHQMSIPPAATTPRTMTKPSDGSNSPVRAGRARRRQGMMEDPQT